MNNVVISRPALKSLKRLPSHIVDKLEVWIRSVEEEGIEEVRKLPGFHDEPLKGTRKGQRSIRLSRSYRAIYVQEKKIGILIEIIEVSNHEY